ncbi:hypothetical protein B0T09DRAFT_413122 [Sordaria sp. MPI-SDFR-AT-0083]|nr:hypothetical protein B0T09DRAFT_413122 [Sordaria sp. MPI-SDFR-AT-0083]
MGHRRSVASGYTNHPTFEWNFDLPCQIGLEFDSPIDNILKYLNEMAFRVSALTASYTNATQWVPVFGLLAAIALYWHYWELPRDHSMSLLELIKSVAHSGDGRRSILHVIVLQGAQIDTAAGLKKFVLMTGIAK